jgi:hypothetical protein
VCCIFPPTHTKAAHELILIPGISQSLILDIEAAALENVPLLGWPSYSDKKKIKLKISNIQYKV